MSLTPEEFFSKEGTVELFCELDSPGKRFSELDDEMNISHSTLSARLRQGEELGFISTRTVQGEKGRTHEYVTTDQAVHVMRKLKFQGLVEKYQLYKESRKRFQEKSDAVQDWVAENSDALKIEEDDETQREKLKRMSPYQPDDPESFEELHGDPPEDFEG